MGAEHLDSVRIKGHLNAKAWGGERAWEGHSGGRCDQGQFGRQRHFTSHPRGAGDRVLWEQGRGQGLSALERAQEVLQQDFS